MTWRARARARALALAHARQRTRSRLLAHMAAAMERASRKRNVWLSKSVGSASNRDAMLAGTRAE